MDRCSGKLVITSPSTSDEWSLTQRPLCVSLSNQGVIFITGTADSGFHTLNLFGEDRRRTIKVFYIVLTYQKLLEVHYLALLNAVLILTGPSSMI